MANTAGQKKDPRHKSRVVFGFSTFLPPSRLGIASAFPPDGNIGGGTHGGGEIARESLKWDRLGSNPARFYQENPMASSQAGQNPANSPPIRIWPA